jgi:hypothetical protein
MEELRLSVSRLVLDIGALPVGRPGVPGILGSFLGIGESFRDDKADATRGTALYELPRIFKWAFD